MHINLRRSHVIIVVLSLLLLFGYVAYKDLIFDPSEQTQKSIESAVDDLPKEDSGRPKPTPEYYGMKRVEVALQEYRKGVTEAPQGCNCGPEVDRYTEGTHAQWCTMFASWVGHQAGSGVFNEKTQSWKIVNSRDFATYLEDHGTWFSRDEVIEKGLKPKLGDYIVFWRGNFEDNLGHVDVVVDIDSPPGSASLVGGNLDNRVKYREYFPYLYNYGFLGFGRPEKE